MKLRLRFRRLATPEEKAKNPRQVLTTVRVKRDTPVAEAKEMLKDVCAIEVRPFNEADEDHVRLHEPGNRERCDRHLHAQLSVYGMWNTMLEKILEADSVNHYRYGVFDDGKLVSRKQGTAVVYNTEQSPYCSYKGLVVDDKDLVDSDDKEWLTLESV